MKSDMTAVIFRKAEKGDIPSLLQLLYSLFSIEQDFVYDAEKQIRGLEMLLDADTAVIIVGEKDGEIIGMATGQVVISTAEGGNALLVEDVVVARSCKRAGIGSALIGAVGAWGQGRGAARMQLLADRNNIQALRFYTNTKWAETALICLRKYYVNDHESCTA